MVKNPSVLSVQRGTIVSDGLMFSILSESETERISVIRHGIRGINNNPKNGDAANIQRTESAKTSPQAMGLLVRFSFRTLPANQLLFACSDVEYRKTLDQFIDRFFRRGVLEFDEVCRRYARNILNGRWLWRNRLLGEAMVTATENQSGKPYSGEGSRLRDFENYTEDEKSLASEVIATGFLSSTGSTPSITVEGKMRFGFRGGVEVFPSQNMVTSKPTGFARSLYKVEMISRRDLLTIMNTARKEAAESGDFMADMIDMGKAAIRDQKIGNAIRTIDTWYPDFDGMPIPVEPNGASLEKNQIFRNKQCDSNALLKKIDDMEPKEIFNPEAAFMIALMIRGGVFSEKQ